MQVDATALILDQLKQINRRLDTAQEDGEARGRRVWEKLNQQDISLAVINQRVGTVEASITGQALTLAQYQDLKAKAAGAGWLGNRLLWIGGGILSAAGWIYAASDGLLTFLKWIVGK